MVSTTIYIIPLLGGHHKDVAGAVFMGVAGKGGQQYLFQLAAHGGISALGKSSGNLVTVYFECSKVCLHTITSLSRYGS